MGYSSITGDEGIMFADNASFDGTKRDGKLAADGQLWIGSTAGRHVRKATLTGGEGVDVTNAAGSITLSGEDASDTNKGIATFDAYDFVVSSGNVTLRPASGVYFVGDING